jgi:nucleotide-binding universal stress UspA family protein
MMRSFWAADVQCWWSRTTVCARQLHAEYWLHGIKVGKTRAVFDALPLLQQAEDVAIVNFAPDETEHPSHAVEAHICTALARHGIKCRAIESMTKHVDVGRSLTQQAISQKADLLVMGCYGHSRLRELVLGGASRHQLRHMLIPVLMSH